MARTKNDKALGKNGDVLEQRVDEILKMSKTDAK
jgi:hypothetical protein